MKNILTYDSETHTYYVDGIQRPGVSDIVFSLEEPILRRIPPQKLEEGRIRGTNIHDATKWDDMGILDMDTVMDEYLLALEGWRKFNRDTGGEWLLIEERLDSEKWKFAGRIDRVKTINGKTTLIDIKSGGILITTKLRLAGYEILWNENNPKNKIKQKWIVQPAKNSYKITPFSDITSKNEFLTELKHYYNLIKYGGG